MPIDWKSLENKISQYLLSNNTNKNATANGAAQFIEDSYIAEVKKGIEQYNNKPLKINKGLKNSLLNSFNSTMNIKQGPPSPLNNDGIKGVKDIWMGGQMEMNSPPPGATRSTSNNIVDPGTTSSMNLYNSDSECPLAIELIKVLKSHSNTIMGKNIGVNEGGAVITGEWKGIK